jgi:predicted metal-dependent hydrolase
LTLTWSQRETSRIFGHHDGAHETIVISRTLDSQDVPEFVVGFVLYHEMLHVKHPVRVVNGRRSIHSAAFRADEKLFPQYQLAQEYLEHLAQAQRRKSAGLSRRAKNLAKKLKLF